VAAFIQWKSVATAHAKDQYEGGPSLLDGAIVFSSISANDRIWSLRLDADQA